MDNDSKRNDDFTPPKGELEVVCINSWRFRQREHQLVPFENAGGISEDYETDMRKFPKSWGCLSSSSIGRVP